MMRVRSWQTMGALLLPLLGLFACRGANPGAPTSKASNPASGRPPSELARSLDAHCGGCHEHATEAVPRLAAILEGDRELALRAALKIASAQMPPAPNTLAPTERHAFIASLCRAGADDPKRCLDAYDPETRTMDVVTSTAYVSMIKASSPKLTPQQAGRLEATSELLLDYDADRLVRQLDPTTQASYLVIAMDACAPLATDAGTNEAFNACVHRSMSRELTSFPDAPSSHGESAKP